MYKELFHGSVLAPPAEWESVHTLTPPPHTATQNSPEQTRPTPTTITLHVPAAGAVCAPYKRSLRPNQCSVVVPSLSATHSLDLSLVVLSLRPRSLVLSWSDTQRLRGGCTKARGLGRCAGGDVVAMVVVGMAVCLCGCPEWQGNREIIYTTTPNYTIQRCCWGGIRRLVIPRTQFD